MKYSVMGVSCGIGSMLIGAKAAGFKVIGNIEKRPDFNTGTFELNFKDAFYIKEFDNLIVPDKVDLVMAHPACGAFSNLRKEKTNIKNDKLKKLLETLENIKKIQPRFFVIDNLPKLLKSFDAMWWFKNFKEYDIFFEYISNYHYGNCQKGRKRLFVIGAKKSEKFVFIPNEKEYNRTVRDVMIDLYKKGYGKVPNHFKHCLTGICDKGRNMYKYGKSDYTWKEFKEWMKPRKEGTIFDYISADGTRKVRFGFRKNYWNKYSGVLSGTNAYIHPKTNLPFSIRERARIQGCPDSFIFSPEVMYSKSTWNHDDNLKLSRQTGKFIPVEFTTYLSKLIIAHLKKKKMKCTKKRFLEDPIINETKLNYCKLKTYNNKKACKYCWLKGECK